MLSDNVVAVYGATGHTGRLVVADLARRGHPIRLGGRDAAALAALAERLDVDTEVVVAELDDPSGLRRLTGGSAVLINCAGPYSRSGEPVAAAAVATGTHYLGHAAEPLHVKRMYDTHAGAGVVVIPGMSFFGGLADLFAAQVVEGMPTVEEIVVAHAVTGWRMTTASKAVAGVLSGAESVTYTDGRVRVSEPGPRRTGSFAFPAPLGRRQVIEGYPAGEVVTIPRHVPARTVRVVMTISTFAEETVLSSEDITPDERARSTFTLALQAVGPADTRGGWIEGRDIYGTGAVISVEAASRLARNSHSGRTGALSPAEAFAPTEFLAALPGLEVHIESQVATHASG
ncbi:MAG TPA: saccharopine dehydrogenase NADP-binding domain-containing protein [Streptosporangiaceae bacterium]|jgi:short subunit dehydrogenase-like uncharacterized protein